MKDWKFKKGILSSKGKETRNCKVTVRISDAVQELPKKEETNYELLSWCVWYYVCCSYIEGGIVSGYKAPMWIKW